MFKEASWCLGCMESDPDSDLDEAGTNAMLCAMAACDGPDPIEMPA